MKKSSPKDVKVLVLLLHLGSESSVGAERERNIRGRRSNRRTTRDTRFERKDVLKINSIPSFNDGIVGYFTDLRVNC